MPRKPSFRRDTDLQKEFRRVNKLVQNKQSKLRRQEGLEVTDVSTVKYKEFGSRKDINNYLSEMNKFLHNKRDFTVSNPHGVNVGSYQEYKEVEKAIKKTNREKDKLWNMVKDEDFKNRGVSMNLTVKEMASPKVGYGLTRFADLEKMDFDIAYFESQKEWEKKKARFLELYGDGKFINKLNKQYKENYLQAMRDALGDDETRKLQNKIKRMSMKNFMFMVFTEYNAHIDFIYDKLSQTSRIKIIQKFILFMTSFPKLLELKNWKGFGVWDEKRKKPHNWRVPR